MLASQKKNRQRGETLIELLLAFAILGMALVTIMRTMNGGMESLSISGQRSQVEAQMRGQLAVLQAAHEEAIKNPSVTGWKNIVDNIGSNRTKEVVGDGCTYTTEKNRMYFPTAIGTSWTGNVNRVTTTGALTPATVTPSPDGNSIWIEAKHTPKNEANFTRGFYDFYIKSCWQGGSGVPQQAKMVTRLYDLEATTSTPVFDNFTLSAGPTNNGANNGACATGSNGRIRYTVTNNNPYRLGNVTVTTTGPNFSRTHMLESNATVSDDTHAGYAAGTYTVTATSAGGSKTWPVTIPQCVVLQTTPFGWFGSWDNSCTPYGWTACEEQEPYLWNCQPFYAEYNTGATLMKEGMYNMRISYGNYSGGTCGSRAWPPQSLYPNFWIDVYVNGSFCGSYALPNHGYDAEHEFTLSCYVSNVSIVGGQGVRVGVYWGNDADSWSPPYDANFRINWLNILPH